jgi:hypothetical protein
MHGTAFNGVPVSLKRFLGEICWTLPVRPLDYLRSASAASFGCTPCGKDGGRACWQAGSRGRRFVMLAANVTPCSTLTSIRSIPARSTTTAGNHIESHTQTIESCLKLIFGGVLIPQPLPAKKSLFRGPSTSRAVCHSGHKRKLFEGDLQPVNPSPDDETKGVRNPERQM